VCWNKKSRFVAENVNECSSQRTRVRVRPKERLQDLPGDRDFIEKTVDELTRLKPREGKILRSQPTSASISKHPKKEAVVYGNEKTISS
jgi:hypothetical protein